MVKDSFLVQLFWLWRWLHSFCNHLTFSPLNCWLLGSAPTAAPGPRHNPASTQGPSDRPGPGATRHSCRYRVSLLFGVGPLTGGTRRPGWPGMTRVCQRATRDYAGWLNLPDNTSLSRNCTCKLHLKNYIKTGKLQFTQTLNDNKLTLAKGGKRRPGRSLSS